MLRPGEAMMAYLVDNDAVCLWVVRQDKAGFVKLPIGRAALEKAVASLRRQLDPSTGILHDFSDEEAFALYQKAFAPAEPLLAGAQEVLLVPDGALQSLPFAVMVTAPASQSDSCNSNFGTFHWLADKYAFTTLPAESSLRALRRFAGRATGDRPFTGFGDPVLKGDQLPGSRGVTPARVFGRGPIADVRAVNSLVPLPETADEVNGLARILGDPKDV